MAKVRFLKLVANVRKHAHQRLISLIFENGFAYKMLYISKHVLRYKKNKHPILYNINNQQIIISINKWNQSLAYQNMHINDRFH